MKFRVHRETKPPPRTVCLRSDREKKLKHLNNVYCAERSAAEQKQCRRWCDFRFGKFRQRSANTSIVCCENRSHFTTTSSGTKSCKMFDLPKARLWLLLCSWLLWALPDAAEGSRDIELPLSPSWSRELAFDDFPRPLRLRPTKTKTVVISERSAATRLNNHGVSSRRSRVLQT